VLTERVGTGKIATRKFGANDGDVLRLSAVAAGEIAARDDGGTAGEGDGHGGTLRGGRRMAGDAGVLMAEYGRAGLHALSGDVSDWNWDGLPLRWRMTLRSSVGVDGPRGILCHSSAVNN
jgi:hypothetical protein